MTLAHAKALIETSATTYDLDLIPIFVAMRN